MADPTTPDSELRRREPVHVIASEILDLPPSCIEFVPELGNSSPSEAQYFVVGTYNLQHDEDHHSSEEFAPKPQSRNGSLILFRLTDQAGKGKKPCLVQTLSYPSAILDLHFLPRSQIFGIVSSTGTISFYSMVGSVHDEGKPASATERQAGMFSEGKYRMNHLASHNILPSDSIVTAFEWHHPTHSPLLPHLTPLMVITTADYSVYLIRFDRDLSGYSICNDGQPINNHTLEAWCCAFSQYSSRGIAVYSGGDDSKVRVIELDPSPATGDFHAKELLPGERAIVLSGFGAGVTSILMMPFTTDSVHCIFLVGSYDDHIRLYSTYDEQDPKPKILAELNLGGGVWRLKFFSKYPVSDPSGEGSASIRKFRVLASCMHAGARILEIKGSQSAGWEIKVVGIMSKHESMNYASDIQPSINDRDERRLCVSTSFYDKLLCVWTFDPAVIEG